MQSRAGVKERRLAAMPHVSEVTESSHPDQIPVKIPIEIKIDHAISMRVLSHFCPKSPMDTACIAFDFGPDARLAYALSLWWRA
jgi:hypothetical protein